MPERPEDAERPPTTRLTCGVTAKDEHGRQCSKARKPAQTAYGLQLYFEAHAAVPVGRAVCSGRHPFGTAFGKHLEPYSACIQFFHEMSGSEILGSIVTWFLYFEFLALITKYYESGLHFPLRLLHLYRHHRHHQTDHPLP